MTPSPTLFGEALNASLQVNIGQHYWPNLAIYSSSRNSITNRTLCNQFFHLQAALAESNLNFLTRNSKPADLVSPSLLQHMQMVEQSGRPSFPPGPTGLTLSTATVESPAHKRVKMEMQDEEPEEEEDGEEEESSAAIKQEYYGRQSAEAEDHDEASSTENYEPLNYKSWHPNRPSASGNAELGEFHRTSLTVEVGALSRHSPRGATPTEFLSSQAVNTTAN